MTRRPAAATPARVAGAPRDGDPGRSPTFIAPAISVIGLVIVAVLSVGLFTGKLPGIGGGSSPGGGPNKPDPNATVAPSGVIIVPTAAPGATAAPPIPGQIVFAKQGNIWIEDGTKATQITDTGRDSEPSWSADGQWIYFIETVDQRGLFPSQGGGGARFYTLTYPILSRIHPTGKGREQIQSGLYKAGGGAYQWFYWLRQPEVSPDGKTVALVSDGPDPTRSDVVLQFYDLKTGKLTKAPIGENPPLGHQDVEWRPDGKQLLYVRNARDGSRGAPAIWTYNPASHATAPLTGPGYTSPAFSPDGKWIAATRTTTFGTDVVILNAKTGTEVLRVTDTGQSWAPVWSPAGDSIAYLTITYQIVDLRLTPLLGKAGAWTLGDEQDLTQYSGLDGASRPGWYVPPDELPTPSPSAAVTSGSAPAGSAAASGTARPSGTPAPSGTP